MNRLLNILLFKLFYHRAPDIDGVMDEELQDELLKDQYHDLPPLP